MTQTPSPSAPSEPKVEPGPPPAEEPHHYPEHPDEPSLVLGRPIEDRAFEAMEGGMGLTAGLVIGTAVAGPVGMAVGGIIGAAAGLVAGEMLERRVGPAAARSDATVPDEAAAADVPDDVGTAEAQLPHRPPYFAYPTNFLLAVAESPAAATGAASALAAAGFPGPDVVVITAESAAGQPAPIASHHRRLAGVMRAVQAATMDQESDLRTYEDALARGHDVVGVHIRRHAQLAPATGILDAAGLTFLNFYGRWSTAQISPRATAGDVVESPVEE